MRVIAVTLIAACFATACQTPCPAPITGPVTRQFICADGSNLRVTFTRDPNLARIEEEGYTTITLPARISGAGYTYAEGGAELRQRGAETTWTRPGAVQTTCSEFQGAAGEQAGTELPRQAMSVGRANPSCPGSGLASAWPRARAAAS